MGILEDKANARLFYKYLSKVYDRINPFIWNEAMRDDALEWFAIDETDRVLDVGCGTGFATEGLLQHTDTVHGLDQSRHQMEKAFAKFGARDRVRFYRGDAERLPFADDSFDKIWSSGSIEYWPNPVDALAEFRRVVKPGGRVLVCSTARTRPSGCSRRRVSSISNTTSSRTRRAPRRRSRRSHALRRSRPRGPPMSPPSMRTLTPLPVPTSKPTSTLDIPEERAFFACNTATHAAVPRTTATCSSPT